MPATTRVRHTRTHDTIRGHTDKARGFTLIELILVIAIIGITFSLVLTNLGSSAFWRQDAAIRKLNELIRFLHHQAISDHRYYRLEFNLEEQTYRAGAMESDIMTRNDLTALVAADVDDITLELNAKLHPSLGETYMMIPPPDYPSLFDPVPFPEGAGVTWIRTMRGDHVALDGGTAYIQFSPQGFSEFAVVQLTMANGAPFTIVVNPFTGLTQTYNEHREFEWTYGKNRNS